ncbi:hypothetical protein EUTSA_v10021848mg [Eutrema salsugineum]|uniref:Uncharacterized protein n=1 Tax=Eutrema salsugineum TaxID=72664 RepID=V4MBN2_EUTSA|nr:uncharacterized protein LOC18023725 [Eutrema salsugineum]ESQ49883.1 hypothetical protein EUTSA_v10021848mg [Eutrema salsugineum]
MYKAKLEKEEALSWWRECLLILSMRFFVQIRSVITKDSGNSIEARQKDWEEEEDQDKNVKKIITFSIRRSKKQMNCLFFVGSLFFSLSL